MDSLTREDLRSFVQYKDGICVSIYMPTHRTGTEMQQDPIRLKNLLREAEETLIEKHGMRRPEAEKLLAPASDLFRDREFAQNQSDGLAIFLSDKLQRTFRLPSSFEDQLFIGSRFHITPLVPLVNGNGRFYVLAISRDEVRLFEGSRFGFDEVDAETLPKSMRDALNEEYRDEQLQYHTGATQFGGLGADRGGTGNRGGRAPLIFHGHGVGKDDDKENVLRYFRIIDDGLRQFLGNDPSRQPPLILAGVEYYLPLYKSANHYHHLVDQSIHRNPEGFKPHDLHAEAWKIVEPIFAKAEQEALSKYQQFGGTGRTSNNLEEIKEAAQQGRVDTLLVNGNRRIGQMDARNLKDIDATVQRRPADDDLIDLIAGETLINNGHVFPVPAEHLPNGSPVAAIFRY